MLFSSLRRPSAFRLPAAVALSLACGTALIGCGDRTAKTESDLNGALADAFVAYGSIAASHLAVPGKGDIAPVVYAAPTVQGASGATPTPTWPDLSLLAARMDQYAAVAARFKAVADNAAATPAQKALAGATLAEIQRLRARQLLRRADLNRAALARMTAALEITLGKIDAEMLGQEPPRGHGVIALVEQGGVDGKIASLADLAKARDAAAAEVEKLTAEVKAAEEGKEALRAKVDALYAKESELKIALRLAYGAEHFDQVDAASRVRCEAEVAEADAAGQEQSLELLARRLALAAKAKVSFESAIAGYEEQRDSAKKQQATPEAAAEARAKKIAELHAQWIADAKALDGQFAAKVDAPLVGAVGSAQEAQTLLAKASKDAGADAGALLPTLAIDQVGLAAELAQTYALRLRAIDAHKAALRELAAREKVWMPGEAGSFIGARLEALTQMQAQIVKAALAACAEAETAVAAAAEGKGSEEAQAALQGLKQNVANQTKIVKDFSKDLPGAASAPEAKPAAEETPAAEPAVEAPKEAPKEESKEEPKAEPAPEAKPVAAPAETPAAAQPETTPAID